MQENGFIVDASLIRESGDVLKLDQRLLQIDRQKHCITLKSENNEFLQFEIKNLVRRKLKISTDVYISPVVMIPLPFDKSIPENIPNVQLNLLVKAEEYSKIPDFVDIFNQIIDYFIMAKGRAKATPSPVATTPVRKRMSVLEELSQPGVVQDTAYWKRYGAAKKRKMLSDLNKSMKEEERQAEARARLLKDPMLNPQLQSSVNAQLDNNNQFSSSNIKEEEPICEISVVKQKQKIPENAFTVKATLVHSHGPPTNMGERMLWIDDQFVFLAVDELCDRFKLANFEKKLDIPHYNNNQVDVHFHFDANIPENTGNMEMKVVVKPQFYPKINDLIDAFNQIMQKVIDTKKEATKNNQSIMTPSRTNANNADPTDIELTADATVSHIRGNPTHMPNRKVHMDEKEESIVLTAANGSFISYKVQNFTSAKLKYPTYSHTPPAVTIHFDNCFPGIGTESTLKLSTKPEHYAMLRLFIKSYNDILQKIIVTKSRAVLTAKLMTTPKRTAPQPHIIDNGLWADVVFIRTHGNVTETNQLIRLDEKEQCINLITTSGIDRYNIQKFACKKLNVIYVQGRGAVLIAFDMNNPSNTLNMQMKIIVKRESYKKIELFVEKFNQVMDKIIEEKKNAITSPKTPTSGLISNYQGFDNGFLLDVLLARGRGSSTNMINQMLRVDQKERCLVLKDPSGFCERFKIQNFLHKKLRMPPYSISTLMVPIHFDPKIPENTSKQFLKLMVKPENLVLLEHFIGKYNEIMDLFIAGNNQVMNKTFPVYARLLHLKRKIVDHGECTIRLDENQEHIYLTSAAKSFNKYSVHEFIAQKLQNPDPIAASAIIHLVFNEKFDIHWELTVKWNDFLKLNCFIESFNKIIDKRSTARTSSTAPTPTTQVQTIQLFNTSFWADGILIHANGSITNFGVSMLRIERDEGSIYLNALNGASQRYEIESFNMEKLKMIGNATGQVTVDLHFDANHPEGFPKEQLRLIARSGNQKSIQNFVQIFNVLRFSDDAPKLVVPDTDFVVEAALIRTNGSLVDLKSRKIWVDKERKCIFLFENDKTLRFNIRNFVCESLKCPEFTDSPASLPLNFDLRNRENSPNQALMLTVKPGDYPMLDEFVKSYNECFIPDEDALMPPGKPRQVSHPLGRVQTISTELVADVVLTCTGSESYFDNSEIYIDKEDGCIYLTPPNGSCHRYEIHSFVPERLKLDCGELVMTDLNFQQEKSELSQKQQLRLIVSPDDKMQLQRFIDKFNDIRFADEAVPKIEIPETPLLADVYIVRPRGNLVNMNNRKIWIDNERKCIFSFNANTNILYQYNVYDFVSAKLKCPDYIGDAVTLALSFDLTNPKNAPNICLKLHVKPENQPWLQPFITQYNAIIDEKISNNTATNRKRPFDDDEKYFEEMPATSFLKKRFCELEEKKRAFVEQQTRIPVMIAPRKSTMLDRTDTIPTRAECLAPAFPHLGQTRLPRLLQTTFAPSMNAGGSSEISRNPMTTPGRATTARQAGSPTLSSCMASFGTFNRQSPINTQQLRIPFPTPPKRQEQSLNNLETSEQNPSESTDGQ